MTRHVWLAPQDALLRREYAKRGAVWCAERLGLSNLQVQWRANYIGLRTKAARGRPFAKGHDPRRGAGRPFTSRKGAA